MLERLGFVTAIGPQQNFLALLDAQQHQLDRTFDIGRLAAANQFDAGLEGLGQLGHVHRRTGVQALQNLHNDGQLDHENTGSGQGLSKGR